MGLFKSRPELGYLKGSEEVQGSMPHSDLRF
jgi:hypothetical protein